MDTKLTLKLDKISIDSAAGYAKQHNRKRHSFLVESLTGVLSEDDLEKSAQEDERARYILRKEI